MTYATDAILIAQSNLYTKWNEYSAEHKVIGRLGAFPIALIEAGMTNVYYLSNTVEQLGRGIILFVGALFSGFQSNDYTLKGAIKEIRSGLFGVRDIPIAWALTPIQIIYQTAVITLDPVKAIPFDGELVFPDNVGEQPSTLSEGNETVAGGSSPLRLVLSPFRNRERSQAFIVLSADAGERRVRKALFSNSGTPVKTSGLESLVSGPESSDDES